MDEDYLALAKLYGYYWNAVDSKDGDCSTRLFIAISALEKKLEQDNPWKLVRMHLDIAGVSDEANVASEHFSRACGYMQGIVKQGTPITDVQKSEIFNLQYWQALSDDSGLQERLH